MGGLKKKAEKIKHMLNSIKTITMALVVRPKDSFVWWLF